MRIGERPQFAGGGRPDGSGRERFDVKVISQEITSILGRSKIFNPSSGGQKVAHSPIEDLHVLLSEELARDGSHATCQGKWLGKGYHVITLLAPD